MDIEEYFIDLISSDTAPIVFTYLSHNDIYNLSFLNKSLVKIIKKKLKEYIVYKINEKLRNILGKNFEIFKCHMKESGIVISGSFILETILDELYDGDIDIYQSGFIEKHEYSALDSFFYNIAAEDAHYNMIADDGWEHCYGPVFNTGSELIGKITNYNISKKKIQVVHLRVEKTIDEIKKHINDFDFDICKNAYYMDSNSDHLEIPYPDQIFSKVTSFKFKTTGLVNSVGRAKKYTQRGFSITLDKIKKENPYDTFDIIETSQLKSWDDANYDPAVSIFVLNKENQLIRGNKLILSQAWGYGDRDHIKLIDNILKIGKENKSSCGEDCVYDYLYPSSEHEHCKGILYQSNAWTDFIVTKTDKK